MAAPCARYRRRKRGGGICGRLVAVVVSVKELIDFFALILHVPHQMRCTMDADRHCSVKSTKTGCGIVTGQQTLCSASHSGRDGQEGVHRGTARARDYLFGQVFGLVRQASDLRAGGDTMVTLVTRLLRSRSRDWSRPNLHKLTGTADSSLLTR